MGDRIEPGIFCGQLVQKVEVSGLLLTEHSYAPGLKLPWHTHAEAYFCLVLQGSYSESFGSKDRDCGPQNLIYHPAGEKHTDTFREAGGRIFHIEADTRFWSLASDHGLPLSLPSEFAAGHLPELALRMHREFQEMDAVSPLIMEGVALEMIAELSRSSWKSSKHKAPAWLGSAVDLIHARFTENLRLEEVARQVGVHPGHLVRVFRDHRRCTIGEYVRHLRTQFACQMLTSSDSVLSEIAQAAGFTDQAHFSRAFRRHMGQTPAEYRRHFRAHKS